MGLGSSPPVSQGLIAFIHSADTIPTYQGFMTYKWDKIYKMPGYSQFSVNVSFPSPLPQYVLTFPFFFFYPIFFLNQESTLYSFSQRRSCQNKMEIEANGQVLTLSNPPFNAMK